MQKTIVLCFLFFACNPISNGLEQNKQQRYNPNSDFLFHETGIQNTPPKRDYVAPNWQSKNQKEYDTQFPSLGDKHINAHTTKPTTAATTTRPSGKRDYMAPTKTLIVSPNSQNTGMKYDSQIPPLGGQHMTSPSTNPTSPTPTTKSSGIRDYVAPQRPTPKPSPGSEGKVKDLVNFYDGMNKNQNGGQISSHTVTAKPWSTVTTRMQSHVTPSPTNIGGSFSNVVSNKPGFTTQKPPTTQSSTLVPRIPTSRPGSPVLPSSIVNNSRNKNNNPSAGTNSATDSEIQTIGEELLRKDTNNAAKYVTVNYQGKTTGMSKDDQAPERFLTISPEAWNIPTIAKLLPLLDNYERDTSVNEHVTPLERNEENAFMDAIMTTSVIRHLMAFLKGKGFVSPDPREQRDYLKQLWFGLYSRGKGKISSSAFEHIFVSESRNVEVLGLHNWIYFSREEAANRINYLGYLKYTPLNDKGAVVKIHFNQQGNDKPVDTMFVGTSPELEIALYTLCFATRHDSDCKLKLANKDLEITTHTFRYRSKNYIGSAYPQI